MKNLQRLIFKYVLNSREQKRDLAQRLGISLFAFESKVVAKDFDIEDIKKMRLPVPMEELMSVIRKDLIGEKPEIEEHIV